MDTRYNALQVSEKHTINGEVLLTEPVTVYISEDLTGDLAKQAAIIMVYMNCANLFLTFTAPGALEGNSHQLALVAACMGLPNTMAYTGGVIMHNYPDEATVVPIQGLTEKLTATKAAKTRLVAPLDNVQRASLVSSGVITAADLTSGSVENPSWYLVGITSISELVNAHLATIGGDYLTTTKNDELMYALPSENVSKTPTPTIAELREDYHDVSNKIREGLTEWLDKMIKEYPGSDNEAAGLVDDMTEQVITPKYTDKMLTVGGITDTLAGLLRKSDWTMPERNTLARALASLGLATVKSGGPVWNLPPIAAAVRQLAPAILRMKEKYKPTIKPNITVKKGLDLKYKPTMKRRFLQEQQEPSTSLQVQNPQSSKRQRAGEPQQTVLAPSLTAL